MYVRAKALLLNESDLDVTEANLRNAIEECNEGDIPRKTMEAKLTSKNVKENCLSRPSRCTSFWITIRFGTRMFRGVLSATGVSRLDTTLNALERRTTSEDINKYLKVAKAHQWNLDDVRTANEK